MIEQPHVLMVFVDGLGLGARDSRTNPLRHGRFSGLARLLDEHAVPADACMGVAGLPQSATGQTALLTGVNASAEVGRHVEGFPGKSLKRIVTEHNIFRTLRARGRTCTFANGYFVDDVELVRRHRLQSVTTVATLSAFDTVRDASDLSANRAVCQDLTREALRPRGYNGPLTTPREAAGHLAAIAREHAFTLFEYFQTDRAGHSGDMARALHVLTQLDTFVDELMRVLAADGIDLLLTSDHGNIEDMSHRLHTSNPVPLAAVGPHAAYFTRAVRSILDVTPAILTVLDKKPH